MGYEYYYRFTIDFICKFESVSFILYQYLTIRRAQTPKASHHSAAAPHASGSSSARYCAAAFAMVRAPPSSGDSRLAQVAKRET